MANESKAPLSGKLKQKALSHEQIISGFNQLRQEQRQLANKIVELESDVNEHKLVIETLNEVDSDRKCFRLIGGVLVERTVKDVLPALEKNKEMIIQIIETLKSQIVTKGKEISEYMDKHNIQIRQEPVMEANEATGESANSGDGKSQSNSGVLVETSQNS